MPPQKKKQKVAKRKGKKMIQSGASWDLSDSEDEKAFKYSCKYKLRIPEKFSRESHRKCKCKYANCSPV